MVAKAGMVQGGRQSIIAAADKPAGQTVRLLGGLPPSCVLLASFVLAGCESLGLSTRDAAPESVLLGTAVEPMKTDTVGIPEVLAVGTEPTRAGDIDLPPATGLMGEPPMSGAFSMLVAEPEQPFTADHPVELPALVAKARAFVDDVLDDKTAPSRDVATLPLFTSAPPGLAFRRNGLHRAITVVEPRLCSYTRADSGYFSPEEAVTDSMLRCMTYAGELATVLRVDCRCRLAALDEVMFLSPERIDWRPTKPALILFQRSGLSENTSGFYGLLEMNTGDASGESVRIYFKDGTVACEGRRTAAADSGGSLELSCFKTDESVQGWYRILGTFLDEPYGVAQAVSNRRRFLILFGLDGQRFDRRLRQFRDGGSGGPDAAPIPPVSAAPLPPAVAPDAMGGAGNIPDLPPPSGQPDGGTLVPSPSRAPRAPSSGGSGQAGSGGKQDPVPVPAPPPLPFPSPKSPR